MPSWAIGLPQAEFESAPLQVHTWLPSTSKPQMNPGTEKTISCRPSAKSTITGVLHVPLSCGDGKFHASSPSDFFKATIDLLSEAAVTITRSLHKAKLEAVPHLRSSNSVPTLTGPQISLPSKSK